MPTSRAASSASSSTCSPIAAEIFRRNAARVATGVSAQPSNARRAAATARSTSAGSPFGTCVTTSAVVGSTTAIVSLLAEGTRAPSM